MRLLSRLAAVPFAIVVVAFAIANRHAVEVSLDPLPFGFGLPLYVVVIGGLAVGFAAGAGSAWLAGHEARRAARGRKARIEVLEGELARLRAAATATATGTAGRALDSERLPPPDVAA